MHGYHQRVSLWLQVDSLLILPCQRFLLAKPLTDKHTQLSPASLKAANNIANIKIKISLSYSSEAQFWPMRPWRSMLWKQWAEATHEFNFRDYNASDLIYVSMLMWLFLKAWKFDVLLSTFVMEASCAMQCFLLFCDWLELCCQNKE